MQKLIFSFIFSFIGIITFSQTKINVKSDTTTAYFTYLSEETNGSISNCKIDLQLNESNISESKISGIALVDNLSTGNPVRDKHLKTKTYFNLKEFTEIKFSSNDIHFNQDSNDTNAWLVFKGTLELKGFKKEVVFKGFKSENKLILKSEIYVDDFGLSIKKGRETSLVTIEMIVPLD